jgi:CDP-diacylglycerol--glycerol-3-phosphate 3-phosphatidyltransferase
VKREILYVSNLLSLSRFLLLGIAVYFLLSGLALGFLYASVVMVVIWLTDVLDGIFARKRNEISELGKIIDPLADKVTIITIGLILLIQGVIPLWFAAVVYLRDLIILTGAIHIKNRFGVVMQSDKAGKLTAFMIGLTLLLSLVFTSIKLYIFDETMSYHIEKLELYLNIMFFISIAFSALSLISYYYKLKAVKSNN